MARSAFAASGLLLLAVATSFQHAPIANELSSAGSAAETPTPGPYRSVASLADAGSRDDDWLGGTALLQQDPPVAPTATPEVSATPVPSAPEEPELVQAIARTTPRPIVAPVPTAAPTERPAPAPQGCPATWFCYPRLGIAGPIVPYTDCSGSTDVGTAIRSYSCLSDNYLMGHAYTQFGKVRQWVAGDVVFAWGKSFTVTGATTQQSCAAPVFPLAPLSMQTSLSSSVCGPVLVVQAR